MRFFRVQMHSRGDAIAYQPGAYRVLTCGFYHRHSRLHNSARSACERRSRGGEMSSKLSAGILSGLVAGVVFGTMMQMMTAPTPEGQQVPMMAMVAKVVRSDSVAVGWLYHLFNSAVIGAIFAWILGGRAQNYTAGIGWGALYGFAWWILGALILMPVLLGMPPFAPLMMAPMHPVAMGSLIGHILYGLIVGVVSVGLSHPHQFRGDVPGQAHR